MNKNTEMKKNSTTGQFTQFKRAVLTYTSIGISTSFITASVAYGASFGSSTLFSPGVINTYYYDSILFPKGYNGTGGTLTLNVCIDPNSALSAEMENPLKNAIATINKLNPTTANSRQRFLPAGKSDFESVALHELLHCVGLDHANSNVTFPTPLGDPSYSTPGPNGTWELDAGPDGYEGTADDIRGDDVNLAWFRKSNNNPFSIDEIVDSTTYSIDTAMLPAGDLFPVISDYAISALPQYDSPHTSAAMRSYIIQETIARTMTHDDVAALRLSMSGLDGTQSTSDDYNLVLQYGGVSNANCDINVKMDTNTAFGACQTSLTGLGTKPDFVITAATASFNELIDWHFNSEPPCESSIVIPQNTWKMISLPCDVGMSAGNTVADVFNNDLGTLGTDWIGWKYTYETDPNTGSVVGAYQELVANEPVLSGVGYWVLTTLGNVTLTVNGEYHSQMDLPTSVATNAVASWNLLGSPFRYSTNWQDTRIIDIDGSVLTPTLADPAVVYDFAWRWTGTDYVSISSASGALSAFDGVWVLAAKPGAKVRIGMPNAERTTP